MFQPKYSFHLNSEDTLCPDLPLITKRAIGGTMALWRTELDPFIKVLPTTSSAVLPLLLSLPGLCPAAHITVYLPTSGREAEFVSTLGILESCIENIQEDLSCPIYIRGDFNVNPNNQARVDLLSSFCSKFALSSVDFHHPSHHHFMGNGASDSQLDLLLFAGPVAQAEVLSSLTCSLTNPLVASHHDLILSSVPLPPAAPVLSSSDLVSELRTRELKSSGTKRESPYMRI